jgi:hypothetical protein
MAGLDFLQAASNTASDAVAGPIDIVSWLMKKAGIPVGDAVGGTAWQEARGLRRPVAQSAESLAGETFGLLSPIGAAAKAPQIARGLLQAGDNLAAPRTLNPQTGAIVYHGSPHKFDRFDSSKIGTGEGAQAYGHGLYLAESPDVARSYQRDLSTKVTADGKPILANNKRVGSTGNAEVDDYLIANNGDLNAALRQAIIDRRSIPVANGNRFEMDPVIASLKRLGGKVETVMDGSLYKVDLPDDAIARMLDWDKPLKKQAPQVQQAIKARLKELGYSPNAGGLRAYHMEHGGFADATGDTLARKFFGDTPDKGAEFMRSQGIPGIRYLDGGSRGTGTGTSNFVVFPGEEDILKILERNGQPLGLLGN